MLSFVIGPASDPAPPVRRPDLEATAINRLETICRLQFCQSATLPTVSDATSSPDKNAGALCILVRVRVFVASPTGRAWRAPSTESKTPRPTKQRGSPRDRVLASGSVYLRSLNAIEDRNGWCRASDVGCSVRDVMP
jgi:hypothetical protein